MAGIHMGYMGHAYIGATLVKIASSSINPQQSIESPALVAGDWNKRAWVYGKIETGGNISGPVAEGTADVWAAAWERDQTVGDKMLEDALVIKIAYYKGGGRQFNECQIDSYELSVQAGDIAQFNINFMGTTTEPYTGNVTPSSVSCEKLITWDICAFTADGVTQTDNLQAFTYTVSNNLERIYKLNQAADYGLYPAEILAGIRDISGSLSFYADAPIDTQFQPGGVPPFGAEAWADYDASDTGDCTVTAGDPPVVSATGRVVFGRAQASAQTGPVVYTVAFTGVCSQTEDV